LFTSLFLGFFGARPPQERRPGPWRRGSRIAALAVLLLAAGCRQQQPAATPLASPQSAEPTREAAPTAAGPFRLHVPLLASQPGGEAYPPPPGATAAAVVTPASPTATPDFPRYQGQPMPREAFGVQIHLHRENLSGIMRHLEALDMGWVKVQVEWKIFEPGPGRYDDYRFKELDRLVDAANRRDIRVLLGVAKAPEWSRPTTEADGPPADSAHFRAFMLHLATRYRDRVSAYELWNEPNLMREWTGAPLSAAALVQLVAAGSAGVREADPAALVISPAPATTGINDGITAVDDRRYLEQMMAAGLAQWVDGIGIHPYGWANPPDSSAAAPDPAVPSHNDHPSFFFADTIRDYRTILDRSGAAGKPLWVTEFGWASYEGLGMAPPQGLEYMADVTEREQAQYTLRAYELALDWGLEGPLILWNLNIAPTFGPEFPETAYSLLRPDGSLRPAYLSLATIPKEG
jgi:hypothetical protein